MRRIPISGHATSGSGAVSGWARLLDEHTIRAIGSVIAIPGLAFLGVTDVWLQSIAVQAKGFAADRLLRVGYGEQVTGSGSGRLWAGTPARTTSGSGSAPTGGSEVFGGHHQSRMG